MGSADSLITTTLKLNIRKSPLTFRSLTGLKYDLNGSDEGDYVQLLEGRNEAKLHVKAMLHNMCRSTPQDRRWQAMRETMTLSRRN